MRIVSEGDKILSKEMPMTAETIYDVVPYRSVARTATHVDRIAVLGKLLAMDVADPAACRVLELGCGDGGNLIPMALSLPGSEFVGFDLAPSAIERGVAAAAAVGVTNVSLHAGDIAAIGPEAGEFDYVIAHGVYSWVPPAVRVALLRLVRERMRPQGLAFISYNALPGDHIRSVVRQMMRMHTADIEDPRKKIEQARALLQLLTQAPGDAGDVYRPLLQSEVGRAMQSSDELLFHDDLADISQPFFFTEFMGAARAAGLQFASEAVFHSMSLSALPPNLAGMLGELAERDVIAKEQYLDFLTCRGFRQTVLCHEEVELRRDVDVDRMAQFRFLTEARRGEPDEGQSGVAFRHRNGSALRTDHALTIRALDLMVAANPRSVPFEELVAGAGATSPEDREALADVLFRTFSVGVTELRLSEPQIVVELTERPTASPWARYTASTGRAANLYHELIELDEPAKKLLPLADGSRTLAELARDAGIDEPAAATTLNELAKLGLLIG
jgi:methyltransferase-like protein/SAM-dependent methyltransferase